MTGFLDDIKAQVAEDEAAVDPVLTEPGPAPSPAEEAAVGTIKSAEGIDQPAASGGFLDDIKAQVAKDEQGILADAGDFIAKQYRATRSIVPNLLADSEGTFAEGFAAGGETERGLDEAGADMLRAAIGLEPGEWDAMTGVEKAITVVFAPAELLPSTTPSAITDRPRKGEVRRAVIAAKDAVSDPSMANAGKLAAAVGAAVTPDILQTGGEVLAKEASAQVSQYAAPDTKLGKAAREIYAEVSGRQWMEEAELAKLLRDRPIEGMRVRNAQSLAMYATAQGAVDVAGGLLQLPSVAAEAAKGGDKLGKLTDTFAAAMLRSSMDTTVDPQRGFMEDPAGVILNLGGAAASGVRAASRAGRAAAAVRAMAPGATAGQKVARAVSSYFSKRAKTEAALTASEVYDRAAQAMADAKFESTPGKFVADLVREQTVAFPGASSDIKQAVRASQRAAAGMAERISMAKAKFGERVRIADSAFRRMTGKPMRTNEEGAALLAFNKRMADGAEDAAQMVAFRDKAGRLLDDAIRSLESDPVAGARVGNRPGERNPSLLAELKAARRDLDRSPVAVQLVVESVLPDALRRLERRAESFRRVRESDFANAAASAGVGRQNMSFNYRKMMKREGDVADAPGDMAVRVMGSQLEDGLKSMREAMEQSLIQVAAKAESDKARGRAALGELNLLRRSKSKGARSAGVQEKIRRLQADVRRGKSAEARAAEESAAIRRRHDEAAGKLVSAVSKEARRIARVEEGAARAAAKLVSDAMRPTERSIAKLSKAMDAIAEAYDPALLSRVAEAESVTASGAHIRLASGEVLGSLSAATKFAKAREAGTPALKLLEGVRVIENGQPELAAALNASLDFVRANAWAEDILVQSGHLPAADAAVSLGSRMSIIRDARLASDFSEAHLERLAGQPAEVAAFNSLMAQRVQLLDRFYGETRGAGDLPGFVDGRTIARAPRERRIGQDSLGKIKMLHVEASDGSQWVKIPVRKTESGAKVFGRASGRWMERDTAELMIKQMAMGSSMGQKLVNAVRKNKVVNNLFISHVNAAIGNAITGMAVGLRPQDWRRAARAMMGTGTAAERRMAELARKAGVYEGSVINDLKLMGDFTGGSFDAVTMAAKQMASAKDFDSFAAAVRSRLSNEVPEFLGATALWATDNVFGLGGMNEAMWIAQDRLFRMSLFQKAVEDLAHARLGIKPKDLRGSVQAVNRVMGDQDIVRRALEMTSGAALDYTSLPRGVRVPFLGTGVNVLMRDFGGMPFVAYPLKATPLWTKNFMLRGQRYNAIDKAGDAEYQSISSMERQRRRQSGEDSGMNVFLAGSDRYVRGRFINPAALFPVTEFLTSADVPQAFVPFFAVASFEAITGSVVGMPGIKVWDENATPEQKAVAGAMHILQSSVLPPSHTKLFGAGNRPESGIFDVLTDEQPINPETGRPYRDDEVTLKVLSLFLNVKTNNRALHEKKLRMAIAAQRRYQQRALRLRQKGMLKAAAQAKVNHIREVRDLIGDINPDGILPLGQR